MFSALESEKAPNEEQDDALKLFMDENKVIDINADDVKTANKNENKGQQLRRKRSADNSESGKIISSAYSNILIPGLRHIFFLLYKIRSSIYRWQNTPPT